MKLPNEDLEFGLWFYRVRKYDDAGRLVVEVVYNTYSPRWPEDIETIGLVDMGRKRAEWKLGRLRRKAIRRAEYLNHAKWKADKYVN